VAAIFSQLTGTYGIDDGSAMLVFTKCKCAKCNGSGHQHKDCPSVDHDFDAKTSSKRDNGTSAKQKNVDRRIEYRHDPDSAAPPAQQDSNRKKRGTKRELAKGVGADGTAKRKIYGPASWTKGMELCSNVINGVVCNKEHLRRLCPPKLAADVAADPTVDDATAGFVTTYVADDGLPTFEVEVDEVDVQRYESMFSCLPDELVTEMTDPVVAPIAPAPTFDLDADTVISMLMLVMAVAVALSVVLATSESAVVDADEVFLIMAVSDGGLDSAWLVERIARLCAQQLELLHCRRRGSRRIHGSCHPNNWLLLYSQSCAESRRGGR
jgi:hypothetical protein